MLTVLFCVFVSQAHKVLRQPNVVVVAILVLAMTGTLAVTSMAGTGSGAPALEISGATGARENS